MVNRGFYKCGACGYADMEWAGIRSFSFERILAKTRGANLKATHRKLIGHEEVGKKSARASFFWGALREREKLMESQHPTMNR